MAIFPGKMMSFLIYTIRIQLELTQARIAVYTPPLSQLGPDNYKQS